MALGPTSPFMADCISESAASDRKMGSDASRREYYIQREIVPVLETGIHTGSAPLPGGGGGVDRRRFCCGPQNRTSHQCNRVLDYPTWSMGSVRIHLPVHFVYVVFSARYRALHHRGRTFRAILGRCDGTGGQPAGSSDTVRILAQALAGTYPAYDYRKAGAGCNSARR